MNDAERLRVCLNYIRGHGQLLLVAQGEREGEGNIKGTGLLKGVGRLSD